MRLADERDRKLDNYCALMRELEQRAAVREAEAQRLLKLAEIDLNSVKRLKQRLKSFLKM
jgi:hypothetical protein